jgi:8-oxo-dGTP pyrophosphatase MutT (NUDIX family)
MRLRVVKEMVSKVIIINRNRILLLKRAEEYLTEKSPWTWDLPGGHREAGESMRETGRREALEETGLEVGDFSFVGKESSKGKLTYFYKVKPSDGRIKLSSEHVEYRWVDKGELTSYREGLGEMYYRMGLRAL